MSIKRYETTFLLPTTMTDEAINTLVKHFEDTVTKNGGTLMETERWGIRRLAYMIIKHTSAHYFSLHYTAPGETNGKLNRAFQLDEDVLRWMILEMPETNFAKRAKMKARVENVEARRVAHNAKTAEEAAAQ